MHTRGNSVNPDQSAPRRKSLMLWMLGKIFSIFEYLFCFSLKKIRKYQIVFCWIMSWNWYWLTKGGAVPMLFGIQWCVLDRSTASNCRPWWLSWMRVRLETRRSGGSTPPRSPTFFRGDWSWNIFYGHSLPSADSRRAVVSFWQKNVHSTV